VSRALAGLGGVLAAGAAFVAWQATTVQGQRSARDERVADAADAAIVDSMTADRLATDFLRPHGVVEEGDGRVPPRWILLLQAARLRQPAPEVGRAGDEDARRLRAEGRIDYLDAVAAERGGRLARWPDRDGPLRVWVQPRAAIDGWRPEMADVGGGALGTWTEAGLPFALVPEPDSSRADVWVLWAPRIGGDVWRIGTTLPVVDLRGWIVGATLTLGLAGPDGTPLDIYTIQNTARHELGHALGLEHSPSPDDIMAAVAGRQRQLSDADRATVRLLYALQPGPLAR